MSITHSIEEPVLEVKGLSVSYEGQRVLDIPSLQVAPNRILAVIGPNGSGKTTLLLCLSLLKPPTTGNIIFNGREVNGRSVIKIRRRFAVVFQEPLLLNTTVWGNVSLGLRLRGHGSKEIKDRSQRWLERFGIAHLAQRYARTLSGGEAQRTSLARAFALHPEVLFLDEPFAALDTPTRQSLFGDVINILRETRCTTILVTHDRNEAQSLAHRIIVLMNGHVVQDGSPREIFSSPSSEAIAKFVGMENILEGTVIASQDCIADIDVQGKIIQGVSTCHVGGKVNVCIRPEDITLALAKTSSSARNNFSGKITSLVPAGSLVRVSLDSGFFLMALITRMSADEMNLEIGKTVYASFKVTAIHIITQG